MVIRAFVLSAVFGLFIHSASAAECDLFPLEYEAPATVLRPEGARAWQLQTYCGLVRGAVERALLIAAEKGIRIQGQAGEYLNRPIWNPAWKIETYSLGDGTISGGDGILNQGYSVSIPGIASLGPDSVAVQMAVVIRWEVVFNGSFLERVPGRDGGFDVLGRPTPPVPERIKFRVHSRVSSVASILIRNQQSNAILLNTASNRLADEVFPEGLTDVIEFERRKNLQEQRAKSFSLQRDDFPPFEIIN